MRQLVVVSIAEMKLSSLVGETLVTHALGSCIGLAIYDPHARVGGLLHAMLPSSAQDAKKALENPCTYVDSGVAHLFRESYKLGLQKSRAIVCGAGCAATNPSQQGSDFFQIGKRNEIMLRKLLWKNGVILHAADFGGSVSRTLMLDIATGEVRVKAMMSETILMEGRKNG